MYLAGQLCIYIHDAGRQARIAIPPATNKGDKSARIDGDTALAQPTYPADHGRGGAGRGGRRPDRGRCGPAFAQPAAPRPDVAAGHTVTAAAGAAGQQSVLSYWTPSRMLAARDGNAITSKPGARVPVPAAPTGAAGQVKGTAPVQALMGASQQAPAAAHGRDIRQTGPGGVLWPGSTKLPPATTTGVVFFTTTGNGALENWRCPASAVNSAAKNEVFTAGHCVYGSLGGQVPGETWHTNWVFVPGYQKGRPRTGCGRPGSCGR